MTGQRKETKVGNEGKEPGSGFDRDPDCCTFSWVVEVAVDECWKLHC